MAASSTAHTAATAVSTSTSGDARRHTARMAASSRHEMKTTAVVAGNPANSDMASAHVKPASHRQRKRWPSATTDSQASGSHAAASMAPKCSACDAV
jgi:hypothetical protein